jgi:hypothetical protein
MIKDALVDEIGSRCKDDKENQYCNGDTYDVFTLLGGHGCGWVIEWVLII